MLLWKTKRRKENRIFGPNIYLHPQSLNLTTTTVIQVLLTPFFLQFLEFFKKFDEIHRIFEFRMIALFFLQRQRAESCCLVLAQLS